MYKETVLICFVLVVQTLQSDVEETQLSPTQSIYLQHAVKDLLGFGDLPAAHRPQRPDPTAEEAPKYMKDLYEKYKYGKISKGRQTGNTVRSIKAQLDIIDGRRTIVFNLSSINPSELVFDGEIHLHRRKRHNDLVLQVAAPYTEWESVEVSESKSGWQSFDVTNTLKSSLLRDSILTAKFVRQDGRSVNVKRIMKGTNKPFLIVFSNDTQNITLDHLDPYFKPRDLSETMIDPETGTEIPVRGRKKHRRRPLVPAHADAAKDASTLKDTMSKLQFKKVDKDATSKIPTYDISSKSNALATGSPTEPFGVPQTHTDATHTYRQRRSIYDNEIPQGPSETYSEVVNYVPPTNAGVSHDNEDSEDSDDEDTTSRLLSYPDDYKQSRRRKNRRKNRKDKTLPLPAEWEALVRKEENRDNIIPAMHGQSHLCGKRKLIVDFADIGWSDWIISPKSFEAHYCAGQCPFPLTKGMRPSNHATIQSLVHAIGIQADVPAPCCVPDSMSSVTLLYFDEHRNVVLKNYPAMTVQSCACR